MASGAVPGRGARGGGGAGGGGPAMAVSPYVQAMQELFRANTRSREFPAHGAKVHSVAWSCCGRRLASGSFDKTASVFLLEKDRLVRSPGIGRAGWCGSVPGALGHPGCWCAEPGVYPGGRYRAWGWMLGVHRKGASPRPVQAGAASRAWSRCLAGNAAGILCPARPWAGAGLGIHRMQHAGTWGGSGS